jgi:hypothetical protein
MLEREDGYKENQMETTNSPEPSTPAIAMLSSVPTVSMLTQMVSALKDSIGAPTAHLHGSSLTNQTVEPHGLTTNSPPVSKEEPDMTSILTSIRKLIEEDAASEDEAAGKNASEELDHKSVAFRAKS